MKHHSHMKLMVCGIKPGDYGMLFHTASGGHPREMLYQLVVYAISHPKERWTIHVLQG